MDRLIIGTGNKAKVEEWSNFLDGKLNVIPISSLGDFPDPEETGETFEENSGQKASYYAKQVGEFVMADDGGFKIDAFGGAPGVKSKRILPGDKEPTDQEQIDYVIEKMNGMPKEKRGTRFTTAVSISNPRGKIIFQDRESLEGYVPNKPGPVLIKEYSYRSILYLPELKKTYAELTGKEYKLYSHKRKLAERVIDFFQNNN